MFFQNILWSHDLVTWYVYLISHAIYILTPLYNLILEIKCFKCVGNSFLPGALITTVLLGIQLRMVRVCNVTTSETNVSFWYLTHLSIPSLQVWTQGLETFFDYSTTPYLPALCGLWTWLPWWQTSSFWWIHWLSPGLRDSVAARSLYKGLVLCSAEMEVAALMGIKRFDHETKVKARLERQNL